MPNIPEELPLGAIATGARHVTDEMFLIAAKALAELVTEEDYNMGCIYPPLTKIRAVSAHIAAAVAEVVYKRDLATNPKPHDLSTHIKSLMFEPVYQDYLKPDGHGGFCSAKTLTKK